MSSTNRHARRKSRQDLQILRYLQTSDSEPLAVEVDDDEDGSTLEASPVMPRANNMARR